jgi:hypothetical protein
VRYSQSRYRHPSDDVADAAPTVEASVQGTATPAHAARGRRKAEGGAESLLAVTAHWPWQDWTLPPSRLRGRRRRSPVPVDPLTDLALDDAVIVEGERDETYASGRGAGNAPVTRCYTVRVMSDDAPKSAFELAMQRLRQKDKDTDVDARPLTDAQKAAIAEVRQVFTAKSAEQEILHQAALRKAVTRQEVELLKENLRRDVERLVSDRDRKIGEIRGETSP